MNGFDGVFQITSRVEPAEMSRGKDQGQGPMYKRPRKRNTVSFSEFLEGEMRHGGTQKRVTV